MKIKIWILIIIAVLATEIFFNKNEEKEAAENAVNDYRKALTTIVAMITKVVNDVVTPTPLRVVKNGVLVEILKTPSVFDNGGHLMTSKR